MERLDGASEPAHRVQIKICGVTRLDDAACVAASGADFIGLNLWPRSKRHVSPDRAADLAAAIRAAGSARVVGLFVDATLPEITAAVDRVALDVIQLHGDESPAFAAEVAAATGRPVWKAVALGAAADLAQIAAWAASVAPALPAPPAPATLDALLLDAPTPGRGGGGVPFDWDLARAARSAHSALRFVLAGGLTPDNVAAAVAAVRPWAVDVASGVESAPGVKDPARVAAFIAAARGAG